MVSIRRPGASRPTAKSSCFRTVILLFIASQSVLLLYKMARSSSKSATAPATNPQQQQHDLTHVLQNQQQKKDSGGGNVRKKPQQQQQPPPHDFEGKHANDDRQDHPNKGAVQHDDSLEQHEDATDDDMKRQKQEGHDNGEVSKDEPDVLTQHGSGPAKLGYVVDLRHERQEAAFRSSTNDANAPPDATATQLGKQFQACEYWTSDRALRQRATCRDPDTVLTAFNAAPFARYVCGQEVAAGAAVVLHHDNDCEPAVPHVFPNQHAVPVDGKGMPAVVVQAEGAAAAADLQDVTCDIPCQYDKSLLDAAESNKVTKMTIAAVWGEEWSVSQTKADPMYQRIERTDYRLKKYYSTVSWLSSVPLAHYDSKKYHYLRNTPMLEWSKLGNKATYVMDDGCNSGRRNKWYSAVEAMMTVDSFGSCNHNQDPGTSNLDTLEGRLELMQKNRIVLALEEGNEKDYITDIVWEALMSGAVPAIYGAANLEKRLPPNAAIYASNFNNWDKFAEHVKAVANDEVLWNSFHEWRKDEAALARFEEMWSFTETPPECRMCRWAYAKQYGLGWNHTTQVVQEHVVPRTLCLGRLDRKEHVVTKPFRELWSGMKHSGLVKEESCTTTSSSHEIDLEGFVVERQVVEHDGVVDMLLQRIERSTYKDDIVLRLEIDGVRNTDGAHFRDTHTLVEDSVRKFAVSSATIQDDKTKVTVLANWATEIRSPSEGVVEVVVLSKEGTIEDDELRRIRVITESTSQLHDKMTEFYPSTFGRLMMHDFIDPLEMYYEA